MRIRCWGSRGSFPVSGPEFVRYGGDTSCVEVESSKGDVVLLDSGTGIRAFGNQFESAHKKVLNIVLSHYHLDHLVGLPYFQPIYDERSVINIYGCPCGSDSVETAIRKLMRAPYHPIDFNALAAQIIFHDVGAAPFMIGALRLTPIRLDHPNGGCGYRIEEKNKVCVFLTDNELGYGKPGYDAEYFEEMCAKADLLIHDGEYTDEEYVKYETWGHSKYSDAIKLATKADAKRLGLYHINSKRTDDGMDAILEDARKIIEQSGAGIECYGIGVGFEMSI